MAVLGGRKGLLRGSGFYRCPGIFYCHDIHDQGYPMGKLDLVLNGLVEAERATRPQTQYKTAHERLYARINDPDLSEIVKDKICLKLVEFKLAKKTAVALFDGSDIKARLEQARARNEAGRPLQEKAIAEARAKGDIDEAIRLAGLSPVEFWAKERGATSPSPQSSVVDPND